MLYRRAVDTWRGRRWRELLVLHNALGRLTPRQRAVLILRFYEDRTERETAEILGCSANTVTSQARHAIARLKELMPELAATFDRTDSLVEARRD